MSFAFIALTTSPQSPRAFGQDDKGEKSKKDRDVEQVGTVGADQCARCHSTGRLKAELERKLDTFIWLKEFTFWEANDIHRNAYDCLFNPLGKQMAEILKYDVTKAKECLVCHSVDLHHAGLNLSKDLKDQRFYTDYGMSCEACHGASNKLDENERNVGWYAPHQLPDWRKLKPEEKRGYNLLDMRNPQVRAEKCASCHVGNSAEGKVVTHDIFAAGHPPLPPLEIVTFAANEPAHWYPGRKNEFLMLMAEGKHDHDLYKGPTAKGMTPPEEQRKRAAESYYYLEGESKDVRDLAIGLVATLRSNVKLIREEATKSIAKSEMLDFTHFDCYACHHDLKVPAGRQIRGYDAVPGRPLPKPWTNEILKSVVRVWIASGKSKVNSIQFEGAIREFTSAMTIKPFGLPKALETGTAKLEGVLDTILAEMSQVKVGEPLFDGKYVEALTKELLGKLTPKGGAGGNSYIDYEVAQMYAWTLKILADEAKAMGVNAAEADAAVKKFASLHDSTKKDTVPTLVIDLREKWIPKDTFVPIVNRLAPRMESIKNFNSLGFRKMFE